MGLFFGGLFMAVPVVGHVVVLGYLSAIGFAAVENAVVVGGLSALGTMLCGLGIPKESVLQYETELKADNFLAMAHGTEADATRARAILSTENPLRLDTHAGVKSDDLLVGAGG